MFLQGFFMLKSHKVTVLSHYGNKSHLVSCAQIIVDNFTLSHKLLF